MGVSSTRPRPSSSGVGVGEVVEVAGSSAVGVDALHRGALVARIPGHGDPRRSERQVDQPGAVDGPAARPTPEVPRAQQAAGQSQRLRGGAWQGCRGTSPQQHVTGGDCRDAASRHLDADVTMRRLRRPRHRQHGAQRHLDVPGHPGGRVALPQGRGGGDDDRGEPRGCRGAAQVVARHPAGIPPRRRSRRLPRQPHQCPAVPFVVHDDRLSEQGLGHGAAVQGQSAVGSIGGTPAGEVRSVGHQGRVALVGRVR
jgi:hypothetical protein